MASALVFVYTSGWCLSQAALRGHTSLGALIYTGPGAGIVLTGLAASGMVVADWHASSGWLADWSADAATAHGKQAAFIVATDLLALTVLLWFLSTYPAPPDGAQCSAAGGAGAEGGEGRHAHRGP